MPALRRFPRCLYCREQLAAHQHELHPACEAPYEAEQAAGRAAEEAEALSEMHAWLDGLMAESELESAHDLAPEWLMGVG
jgi:hypothetical protein